MTKDKYLATSLEKPNIATMVVDKRVDSDQPPEHICRPFIVPKLVKQGSLFAITKEPITTSHNT